jgi:2-polyprenyl-3-methyl-5-hydroxy-6-metoxy-1,4-benzoquinol methylase
MVNQCPSCNNPSSKPFKEINDWFLTKERFTLSQCTYCSLIYTRDIPKNISDYYKSEEYISHSEKKTFLSSVYKSVQGITLNSKKRLIKKYSPGKNILDYGAGKGDFSAHMVQSGFNVIGFEPDSDARKLALEKNDITLTESINSIPESSIDAITMWHVLEHIPNPNEIITQLKTTLKQSGLIIIAVPNYKSFDSEYYGKYWAAYDVPRHVAHYDFNSMSRLLNQNGLKVIQTKRMWFDSTYVSLLSEKYRTLNAGRDLNIFHQINAIVIGLLSNLTTIFNKNRCSSLIYVIKQQ